MTKTNRTVFRRRRRRTNSVTARAIPEIPLFRDDQDRLLFVLHLGRSVRRAGLALHAYCIMGTHYHAVVEGSAEALSNTFHWLNSHYAREYNARHGRRGSLSPSASPRG
jgi:hypothetical protein